MLNAWYFVYMSDRIRVSLNWGRLCIVCEQEAEERSGEEATKKRRHRGRGMVLECFSRG